MRMHIYGAAEDDSPTILFYSPDALVGLAPTPPTNTSGTINPMP